MISQDELKKAYIEWLNSKINLRNLDGIIEISTPFLDRHHDHLQIYVVPQKNGLRITDDGYIVNDLESSGCDVFSSNKRREMFETILNGFGISFDSKTNELFVDASIQNFPLKKHMLLQAMMTVNDMFLTSRTNVASLFLEDIERFFGLHEVIYVEQPSFHGKSGFTHRFDFVLPRIKNLPERLVSAINNPTRDRATNLLFAWEDTRSNRKNDVQLLAILNDEDKKVSKDVVHAFEQYEIKVILWSERNEHLNLLVEQKIK